MALSGSWRSTASMSSAALFLLAANTVPKWLAGEHVDLGAVLTPENIQMILSALTAIAMVIAGKVQRDDKVTSEQAIGIPAVAAAKAEERVAERKDVASVIDAAVR